MAYKEVQEEMVDKLVTEFENAIEDFKEVFANEIAENKELLSLSITRAIGRISRKHL